MLIELIEKLIDRCIGLVKEHKEIKRKFLNDFVEPIYTEFQEVHDEYIDCFKKYRSILQENDTYKAKVARLRDIIKQDNLFTSGQRAKFLQLDGLNKSDDFIEFIKAIKKYLYVAFDEILGAEDRLKFFQTTIVYQGPRNSLAKKLGRIDELQDLDDNKKQERAIIALDNIVVELQRQYSNVSSKYNDLNRLLILSPLQAALIRWPGGEINT